MPRWRVPDDDFLKACDVHQLVRDVMEAYHERLADVKLSVDILLAYVDTDDAGNPLEEALKLHGYPCMATIKIRGPKDRAEGRGDVLLSLDVHAFLDLSDTERAAVIDHELTHVDLQLDKNGKPKTDDYGRPKLTLRLHDRQFGWFDAVALRHGRESQEVQQAAALHAKYAKQLYFPGALRK